MKKIIYILITIAFISCKNEPAKVLSEQSEGNITNLKYAEGFSLTDHSTYKILNITNPWPKADKVYRYALIDKEKAASVTLNKDEFDGIILMPIESCVVTSTTHIPALELLGVEHTLKGFPGTDYVSSEKTRQLIDQGEVREIGKNEDINTEVLLELRPDVVIGYGVSGVNNTFETIKKSGIPVIYNGDWVESSALAKAEWVKFFGILFNKEKKADSIFNSIEKQYNEAKQIAAQSSSTPSILAGAMHKDVWYLPNGTSPEAQFLKDANVNYLWHDTTGKGSLSLSIESVLEKGQHADIWLSPSYYRSLEALQNASEHYTRFNAFKKKTIYTFSNTTGTTGGVLYYELGTARPDLVLKDIIKICHPELLPNYQPFFFKPLQ